MSNFKITIDQGDIGRLSRRLEGLKKGLQTTAIRQGLQRTSKQAVTAASSQIRSVYNIKKQDLDRRFSILSSSRKLSVLIRARSLRTSRIPVINFGAKPAKGGVRFSVRSWRSTFVPGAFITTMRSGHKGAFIREKGQRAIKQLMGIDVPAMFSGAEVMPAVAKRVSEQLEKNIVHELNRHIAKQLGQ